MKPINKLKQEYLNQIRFKCNNAKCTHQLTYDELILGTHELDTCPYLVIVCEGCGQRIFKQDQIKHEAVECRNPLARFGHLREHSHRPDVKIEYVNNPLVHAYENQRLQAIEYDQRPDQEYKPNGSSFSGNTSGSKAYNKKSKSSFESKNSAQ